LKLARHQLREEKEMLRHEKRACYWEKRRQDHVIRVLREKLIDARLKMTTIRNDCDENITFHKMCIAKAKCDVSAIVLCPELVERRRVAKEKVDYRKALDKVQHKAWLNHSKTLPRTSSINNAVPLKTRIEFFDGYLKGRTVAWRRHLAAIVPKLSAQARVEEQHKFYLAYGEPTVPPTPLP
jgi:hypothetical protein